MIDKVKAISMLEQELSMWYHLPVFSIRHGFDGSLYIYINRNYYKTITSDLISKYFENVTDNLHDLTRLIVDKLEVY